MKYMMTYDLMESVRNTNQWLGASARAFASYPAMSFGANPAMDWLQAWGEVTERTFARMVMKPDWNIPPVTCEKGKDHPVVVETVVKRPFGDLIRFTMPGRKPSKRRVLLVAPMSGHYATLLRKTVISLLPDCDVYITDWTYRTYRNMIALTWEREHFTQELGDLTGSLRERNRQLRDARRQLTLLANVDELTGLGNRRLVNSVLQKEINRARRAEAELSVILLDVDYFKNYNDTYGHVEGNEPGPPGFVGDLHRDWLLHGRAPAQR